MIFLPLTLVHAGNASGGAGGVNLGYYGIMAALLAGVVLLVKWIFSKRAQRSVDEVAGGTVSARIAPAPPLPESIARLRALVGETSAEPRITRYTVPVITASETALTIADKKIGQIVSIPAADITSVQAGVASINPKGTLKTLNYPSLWVTVTRDGAELIVPLTPLTGMYDKLSENDVESLAGALRTRLGVAGG